MSVWDELVFHSNFCSHTFSCYSPLFNACIMGCVLGCSWFHHYLVFIFQEGWSSLMGASFNGHEAVVMILVSAGAHVDLLDKVSSLMECGNQMV